MPVAPSSDNPTGLPGTNPVSPFDTGHSPGRVPPYLGWAAGTGGLGLLVSWLQCEQGELLVRLWVPRAGGLQWLPGSSALLLKGEGCLKATGPGARVS